MIDTATDTVSHTLQVGLHPHALVVAPDGSKVYVGQNDGKFSIITTRTKSVTSIPAGGDGIMYDMAITADGRRLYLAMGLVGFRVVDTDSHRVSTLRTEGHPMGLALTPDGRFLYVNYQNGGPGGPWGHDAVGRVDASTGAFLGSTTGMPHVGQTIVASPDGSQSLGERHGRLL